MKRMTEAEAKSFAEKWLAGKIKGTEFTGAVGEPWKCLHHMIPYELTTEPVVNRVVYVLLRKPLDEIEVRLAEMEPWIWEGFPALEQARSDYYKAQSDYNKARSDYDKAQSDYNKARSDYNKARIDYYKARIDYYKARSDYNKAASDALPQINGIIRRERPDSKWDGVKVEGTA